MPICEGNLGDLITPWRTHRQTTIAWEQVILGHEVRLGHAHNKQIEQLWTVIRACIIRVIWMERNRRYFYATSPRRTSSFRRHQGKDDIKMHVEGWLRRAEGKT